MRVSAIPVSSMISTTPTESRAAVECGYWPLFRFDPALTAEGKNPFVLDSKKVTGDLEAFLNRENRFVKTAMRSPTLSAELHAQVLAPRGTSHLLTAYHRGFICSRADDSRPSRYTLV